MRPAAQIAVPLEPAGVPPARLAAARAAAPAGDFRARAHEGDAIPPDLARDWAELAVAAAEPNSYAEAWFVAASLETLGQERGVRLAEVRRGSVLVGVMPLSLERFYGRLTVPFVQNWCHHHLFLGTPLVRRGEEQDFWSAILDLLDEADWAPNLLHLRGLVEEGPVHRGLVAAARRRGRSCATVHRESRALLAPDTDAESYYRAAVRPKKRKEIRRLQTRLAELGPVRVRELADEAELAPWCDAFLAMERAGWKGRAGSALACEAETETFFRWAVGGAWAAGRLRFLRLDLGERPIAMLVNFLAPPGSFAFKTCFDEEYARFSPGVLIQLENLRILATGGIAWMDSCAAADHPMIDSLWTERRTLVRATVRLKGLRRSLVFAGCRALESGSAMVRRLRGGRP